MEIDFDKALEFVDSIYHEEDYKNRLFNIAKLCLNVFEHKICNRASSKEWFNEISWVEKEKIFYDALEDLVNEIWKDFNF